MFAENELISKSFLEIAKLNQWCFERLPTINKNILESKTAPTTLIQSFSEQYTNVGNIINSANLLVARQLLRLLPFGIFSIERHLQESGEHDSVFSIFPKLESDLLHLAKIAQHPPRDSLYTYVLWNRENVLSFSGDQQEKLFIDVTYNMIKSLERARQSSTLAINQFDPENLTETNTHIEEASHQVEDARKQLLRFLEKKGENERALDIDFFRNNMRQYWITRKIGGEEWGPPTPANCVPQMALDILLGIATPAYKEHIQGRYRYMIREDQDILQATTRTLTLLSITSHLLNINEASIQVPSGTENFTPNQKQIIFLRTYYDLLKKASSLTALHWTILTTYLARPLKQDNVIFQHNSVYNAQGASGMQFTEVAGIKDMRRKHPIIENIKHILSQTGSK